MELDWGCHRGRERRKSEVAESPPKLGWLIICSRLYFHLYSPSSFKSLGTLSHFLEQCLEGVHDLPKPDQNSGYAPPLPSLQRLNLSPPTPIALALASGQHKDICFLV